MKQLLLGTAQWGWSVSSATAFQLLDEWLRQGYTAIDGATNYPINRQAADFRAAEKILREYVRAHGLHNLDITMKVGSLDNMRSPEVNLAPSFIQMMAEEYLRLFDQNIKCLMLHWDNRHVTQDIQDTLMALERVQNTFGLRPGLSGIAHPEVYAQVLAELNIACDIQLKVNVLQDDFVRYAPLVQQKKHRFFAYGINAGGVKIEENYTSDSTFLMRGGQPEKTTKTLAHLRAILPDLNLAFVRPPLKTMNHVGLMVAALHPHTEGVLLGVSSMAQLRETLDFWRNLDVFDYSDAWKKITEKRGV
jgi:aryl-alcohol dehydrogenase-like predicted oxidoreductase